MSPLVEATTGVLQPLIWNMVLYFLSMGKYMGCSAVANWGLFWYNDGGEMGEACLNTGFVGATAEYES